MSGWDGDYCYEPAPLYEHIFRCGLPRDEGGNRIVMPLSSLHLIETLPVKFPLFFKIEGFNSDKVSYCGVLDFTAEEGFVHLPGCMMKNLGLEVGDDVVLRDASLSKGSYMKLRPHETAFVEVSDPKAVLEQALRDYACLSRGDTFMVRYDGRDYYLDVMEVRPGEAVSLIETDCVLEFAPALDYLELPQRRKAARSGGGGERAGGGHLKKGKKKVWPFAEEDEAKKGGGKEEFEAFSGKGRVLGGHSWEADEEKEKDEEEAMKDGEKDERKKAKLKARGGRGGGRVTRVYSWDDEEEEEEEEAMKDGGKEEFKAFSGKGRVLGGRFLGRVVVSSRRAVVAGFSYKAALVEGKKIEKDGDGKDKGKVAELKACGGRGGRVTDEPSSEAATVEAKKGGDGEKHVFKAFSGKGRVLGGSSLDAVVESDGWSVPVSARARAAAVVEDEKKKEEFKAFSGKGRVLGSPILF